jgi:hypothetical protein
MSSDINNNGVIHCIDPKSLAVPYPQRLRLIPESETTGLGNPESLDLSADFSGNAISCDDQGIVVVRATLP